MRAIIATTLLGVASVFGRTLPQMTEENAAGMNCCPGILGKGHFSAPSVSYGLQWGSADKKVKDDGRAEGAVALNRDLEMFISLLGGRRVEDSCFGKYIFRCNRDHTMKSVVWSERGCATYSWKWELPNFCVGDGNQWNVYRDSIHFDWMNHLFRFQPPCKMATLGVTSSCMPAVMSLNLTNIKAADASSLPADWDYQPRDDTDAKTLRGDAMPEDWYAAGGVAFPFRGYISTVLQNGTTIAPPRYAFGVPSWCKKGVEMLDTCGV